MEELESLLKSFSIGKKAKLYNFLKYY